VNEGTAPTHPLTLERGRGFQRGGTILACMPQLHTGYPQRIQPHMSVFGSKKAPPGLEERLAEVAMECSALRRDARALDLEFTNLYDKVSRQMSRMAKRHAVDAKENGGDPEVETETPFDHLDPVSKSIMLRRARMAQT